MRVSVMPPAPKNDLGEREIFTKEPIQKHMTFRQKVEHCLKMIPDGLTKE